MLYIREKETNKKATNWIGRVKKRQHTHRSGWRRAKQRSILTVKPCKNMRKLTCRFQYLKLYVGIAFMHFRRSILRFRDGFLLCVFLFSQSCKRFACCDFRCQAKSYIFHLTYLVWKSFGDDDRHLYLTIFSLLWFRIPLFTAMHLYYDFFFVSCWTDNGLTVLQTNKHTLTNARTNDAGQEKET